MKKHYDYEINLFVDGELEQDARKELFAHLAECDECSKMLEDLIRLKDETRKIVLHNLTEIKKKPKNTNLFYRAGFYTSAAAAIVLLFLLASAKPKETFVTKNEVRVDTVFVKKEVVLAKNQPTKLANSATPGKRIKSVESSQKEYLRYVMNLRTEKITDVDQIKGEM